MPRSQNYFMTVNERQSTNKYVSHGLNFALRTYSRSLIDQCPIE